MLKRIVVFGLGLILLLPVLGYSQPSSAIGMQPGQVVTPWSAFTLTAPITSQSYSIGVSTQGVPAITWQTIFPSAPASITVNLQASSDGTTYATIDSSTSVTSAMRSVFGTYKFIRFTVSATAGGTLPTITILAVYSTGNAIGTTSGSFFSGGTFTGPIHLPAGSAAVPVLTGPTSVDGIYFPGVDQINISMSGNARWTFNGLSFLPIVSDTNVFGGPGTQLSAMYVSRAISGGRSKSLTDGAVAVTFMSAAIATNGWYAGELGWTATSVSGANQLIANGRVRYWATDTAGTPVCGINKIGTDGEGHSGGVNTLVCTLTNTVVTTNCAVQVTCTNDTAAAQAITFYGRNDSQLTTTLTFP